jgi:hypothetical protein
MYDFIRQFQHYQPVFQLQAARFPRSRDEFAECINAYLQDPSLDRIGRRKFVELEVGAPIGQSSQKLIEVLERISL